MMPAVAQRADVECGRVERHTEVCSRLRLDAALEAYRQRRWKRWMVLRSMLTQRPCTCTTVPLARSSGERRCSFAGEVDAEIDVETGTLVWTCPRCFADHFAG